MGRTILEYQVLDRMARLLLLSPYTVTILLYFFAVRCYSSIPQDVWLAYNIPPTVEGTGFRPLASALWLPCLEAETQAMIDSSGTVSHHTGLILSTPMPGCCPHPLTYRPLASDIITVLERPSQVSTAYQ